MYPIAEVFFAFLLSTIIMVLGAAAAISIAYLIYTCSTHPSIGFPIVVFIWVSLAWIIHHAHKN